MIHLFDSFCHIYVLLCVFSIDSPIKLSSWRAALTSHIERLDSPSFSNSPSHFEALAFPQQGTFGVAVNTPDGPVFSIPHTEDPTSRFSNSLQLTAPPELLYSAPHPLYNSHPSALAVSTDIPLSRYLCRQLNPISSHSCAIFDPSTDRWQRTWHE